MTTAGSRTRSPRKTRPSSESARGRAETPGRRDTWIAVAAILAFAALRFGYFFHEPPGRDQGVFSNLADGVLHGKLLYRDLWENKPPGVAWLYAAAIALFGRGKLAIHLLQAAFATATALLVGWLVRRAGGATSAAVVAALLYVLHAGGVTFGGFWGTAQAEVFMDLPIAIALALLLRAREREDRSSRMWVGLAGLCVGWTFLLKYSAAPWLGLVLVAWGPRAGRERMVRLSVFVVACAIPFALLAAGMAAAGAWKDFERATVLFNAAYRAASEPSRLPLLERIVYSPSRLMAVWILAACGTAATALRWRQGDGLRRLATAAIGMWGLALLQVFWQGKFWMYHYHVILLPLVLLAGVGASRLIAAARTSGARRAVTAGVAIGTLALLVPYARDLADYDRRHDLFARWSGRVSAERMEATYGWGDYAFAETKAVAAEVAQAVPPGERIFVWGFEPYVYFLSRRESASRFQYDLPLMPRYASLHPIFAAQLMDDLRRHPPALMIVVANDANDVEPEDSVRQLLAWSELRQFVESRYAPAWRTGDFLCLARRPSR